MPPSTPAPALSQFGEDNLLPPGFETDPEFLDPLAQTTGVRSITCDTDPVGCPEFERDTDRSPSPRERDPEAALAVAEQIRAMTSSALAAPRVPHLDDLGEPDVFIQAFVEGGGGACLRANDDAERDAFTVQAGVKKDAGFAIDLTAPDLEDDNQ